MIHNLDDNSNTPPEVEISLPPPSNIELTIGEGQSYIIIQLRSKKTLRNRFKYWMLCQFFPFKITRWEDLE